MSVKRYHLYAGLDVHAFAKCEAVLKYCVEDEGVWVMYEDYARLKAEVERLNEALKDEQAVSGHRADEVTRFKAEVERLKVVVLSMTDEAFRNARYEATVELPEGWNSAVRRAVDLLAEKDKEIERLTKLCQATSPDGFIHIRDIKHHPLMSPAWDERNAAKEGKPSV